MISGDNFFSFGGKFEIFVKILQVQEKYRRFKRTINEEPIQIVTFCEQIKHIWSNVLQIGLIDLVKHDANTT